jgi:sn-1 stearoyl-lipid 9-desaturase
MTFLQRVLDVPSYGWEKDGKLVVPTHGELFREFLSRVNVFADRKNWLPFFSWFMTVSFTIPLAYFMVNHFSWAIFFGGLFYSMVLMGSHGTFWFHRYGTHRAYTFRNQFVAHVLKNLVIKVIPDEIYIISHHVHHQFPEQPGDPYNVHGGWLYCFLADANHQMVAKDLTEKDHSQLVRMLNGTVARPCTYTEYKKWGTLCHPFFTVLHYFSNWAFWFGTFYLLGGIGFATGIFGMAGVWAFGVRTFNYEGHGKGKDRRRDGIDFNRKDWSVNQVWPGYVAGEWHNNHHLFPNGARSGFLRYQFDFPWIWIRTMSSLGLITSYRDYRDEFLRDYYRPYLLSRGVSVQGSESSAPARA